MIKLLVMAIQKIDSLLLIVNDVSKTVEFYKSLGFEIVKNEKEAAIAKLGDFELHFHDKKELTIKNDADVQPRGGGIYIYVNVENIDDFYKTLIEKGLKPSSEPRNWQWGNREFAIRDPDEYKIVFYEELQS